MRKKYTERTTEIELNGILIAHFKTCKDCDERSGILCERAYHLIALIAQHMHSAFYKCVDCEEVGVLRGDAAVKERSCCKRYNRDAITGGADEEVVAVIKSTTNTLKW